MADDFSTVYYGIAGLILNAGVIGVLAKLLWNSQEKKIDTMKEDMDKNVERCGKSRVGKDICDERHDTIKEEFKDVKDGFKAVLKRFDEGTAVMGELRTNIALISQKLGVKEED